MTGPRFGGLHLAYLELEQQRLTLKPEPLNPKTPNPLNPKTLNPINPKPNGCAWFAALWVWRHADRHENHSVIFQRTTASRPNLLQLLQYKPSLRCYSRRQPWCCRVGHLTRRQSSSGKSQSNRYRSPMCQDPKGPKYLYGTKYGFCSITALMVWVSIPYICT